jgi:uncharacterized membrane protein YgdD (TMEM256/DUF423 family)
MTSTPDRAMQRLGAIFAFFGVALGALAAHGPVHDYLARAGHLDYWRTGIEQQWLHALALLGLSNNSSVRPGCVLCWLLGVVLFSGSLYILSLNDSLKWAGPLTPLGGIFLLAGWGWFWISMTGRR